MVKRNRSKSARLVVCTWPGVGQEYILQFCESLRLAEVEIKRVENPWNALFLKLDIFHIHWPEKIIWDGSLPLKMFRAVATIVSLIILKSRGVLLVWCVHNYQPHDASRHLLFFWRFYISIISSLVDGFITLSPSTVEIVRQKLQKLAKKPGTFVWHPVYRVPGRISEIGETRHKNGLAERDILLCSFGFQKRYKGTDELVSCFLNIKNPKFFLGIVGVADHDTSIWLNGIAKDNHQIILDLKWLPERELFEFVSASDVVVLPFKSILHSGSLIYALSCGKPVITPATAYALDLQRMLGRKWVRTYAPPLSAELLIRLSGKQLGNPNLGFLSLADGGRKLKYFYECLQETRQSVISKQS